MESDERTGLSEDKENELILSFGVVSDHERRPADLGVLVPSLLDRIDRVRQFSADAGVEYAGYTDVGHWNLMVANDAGARTKTYKKGRLDRGRLAEAVRQVPEVYDKVWLTAEPWARIGLDVPHMGVFLGRKVRSLEARVLVPRGRGGHVAGELVEELQEAAQVPGVLTGYVHLDSIDDPYTKIVTGYLRMSDDDFAVEIHGYYWTVLLTQGHIAQLGGVDCVLHESPCASVEPIVTPDGRALLCTLTKSPDDLNLDVVGRWEEFLRPLKRKGFPVQVGPLGRLGSPLHRPVWLVEGQAISRDTEDLLKGGPGPETPPGPPVRWDVEPIGTLSLTCCLYPSDRFRTADDVGMTRGVVKAWRVLGLAKQLHTCAGGRFESCSVSKWTTDESGRVVLTWTFIPGDADPAAALDLLSAALATIHDPTVFDGLRVIPA